MKKWVYTAVILATVLGATVRSAPAEEQTDPYANYSALVETFVVEVTTEALREAGADIVGRDPAGISISKLLWALRDEENGRVVSGLKVSIGSGRGKIQAQEEKTEYFPVTITRRPQNMPAETSTSHQSYTASQSLTIEWFNVFSPNSVRIAYTYVDNIVLAAEAERPPTLIKSSFNGALVATSGEPIIAGASQSEDKVRLMVFVVTLKVPAKPAEGDVEIDDTQAAKNAEKTATTPPSQTSIQTITFAKGMNLVGALSMLSEFYKINIVPSQKVLQSRLPVPVTALYNVNLEETLQAILGDYRYIIQGNIIKIYTAEEFAELQHNASQN